MIQLDRPGQGGDGLALFPLRAMGCTVNLSWPAFCLESRPMNVFGAIFVVLVMCAVLSAGVTLLVAGKPLLVLVSGAVFAFMFIKYGCLAH
jgi:hypothetical protein